MEQKVALVHPYGAPFVRETVRALAEAGCLETLFTTLAFGAESRLNISPAFQRLFSRRCWIPHGVNISRDFSSEIFRQLLLKSGFANLLGIRPQTLSDLVYSALDKRAAKALLGINSVYCYEDGALATFKAARDLDISRVYDLPIIHYQELRRIEESEALNFPELRQSFFSLSDSPEKHERKDCELALATKVIVASNVTKDSLIKTGYSDKKIAVVPYGAPEVSDELKSSRNNHEFKAIFIGRVGPRKGVHRLLSAWKKLDLKNANLTLVGINEFPAEYLEKKLGNARFVGPKPWSVVKELLMDADLLVFPSLAEGFGLVILEAMAHGVPVLATERTALPEILCGREGGLVVKAQDSEALENALEYAYINRSRLQEMGEVSRKIATEMSWSRYRNGILREVVG